MIVRAGARFAALLGAALLLRSGVASASPCVQLPAVGVGVDGRLRDKTVQQLSASLSQHGIGICEGDGPALAEVEWRPTGKDVAITIRDAVTKKEVSRTVRLGAVPADGRALALAVASDELLRATWAEILLSLAPAPPPEPPPAVRALVVASLPPERPRADSASREQGPLRRLFLAANVAGEHATGGLSLAGVDARFGVWIVPRLNVGIRVGARAAPSTSAKDGSATANALTGGASLGVSLLPRAWGIALEVPARLDLYRVQFLAHPVAGAVGTDAAGVAVTASSGLALGVPLGRGWRLDAEVNVGAVLHAIDANDSSQAFTSLSGIWLSASLGIRAEL